MTVPDISRVKQFRTCISSYLT